jgi:hypothetical protein
MFIDVVFIDSVLQSSEDIYRECLSGLYMENVFVFMDSAFLVCIWAWTVSFWCVYGHEQCLSGVFMGMNSVFLVCLWAWTVSFWCVYGHEQCLSGVFMDSVFLLCWWQLFFSGAFIELFLNMVRLLNYFSICCVHWTICLLNYFSIWCVYWTMSQYSVIFWGICYINVNAHIQG